MDLGPTVAKASQSERLQEAIASYMQAVDSGRTPDQQEWLTRYPDVATDLADFFANQKQLDGLVGMPKPAPSPRLPPSFGDYEILEEIGRGGMGVVYKARQVGLKRIVALKMILAGVFADRAQVARFRQEAEAVARLQHPNIVQVYEIGDYEGQPYFSLEYVDGGSLEKKLKSTPLPPRQSATLVETLARAVQAAHERGVVHRDLKPANVLLTTGKVVPKITDFGLAKLLAGESSASEPGASAPGVPSRTGDIMGTASYMAREQATGHIRDIGPRTDVYALGAILYELLTGRPPFRGATLLDTLEQVRSQEPVPPTQLQPKTPRDLETICLKCLQKELHKRYASAEALADDLQRFLEGRPILARPVGPVERTWRWCRRNPKLAATGASLAIALVVVAVTSVLLAIHYVNAANRRAETASAVSESLGKATLLRDKAKAVPVSDYGRWREALSEWREALALAKQTEQVLATAEADEDTRRRVQELVVELEKDVAEAEKDRWMVGELAETRTQWIDMEGDEYMYARADTNYKKAFEKYGFDERLSPQEAAAMIRNSTIRVQLAAGLDDWALVRFANGRGKDRRVDPTSWMLLVEAARLADPDPDRNLLRTALLTKDNPMLLQLARSPEVLAMPPATQVLFAEILVVLGHSEDAVSLLRKAQQRNPGDFWINHQLALHLDETKKPAEAIRFYTAALALRPPSAVVHVNLGFALSGSGAKEEAIAAYRRATKLQPDLGVAHSNLGTLLYQKGDCEEAVAELRQAVRYLPKRVEIHGTLGNALAEAGDWKEAIASYREGIRIDPERPALHHNLGRMLLESRRFNEAIPALQEASRLDPKNAATRIFLGLALQNNGQFTQALVELKQGQKLAGEDPLAAEHVRHCERLIELYLKLPALLQGQARLDDAAEAAELAHVCKHKSLYGASAILFAKAFAAKPQLASDIAADIPASHSYNAACSAALAGAGHGKDNLGLDDQARTQWRKQALEWLNADLSFWAKQVENPDNRRLVTEVMEHWKNNHELACVRDEEALAKLPEGERETWRRFWDDVDVLLKRSRPAKDPIARWRDAIRYNPDDALAHAKLGHALYRADAYEDAVASLKEAIRLKNRLVAADLAEVYLTLGLLHWFRGGRPDEAIEALEEAILLEPELAEAHLFLGHALMGRGRFVEAQSYLRQAHELGSKKPGWAYSSKHQIWDCEQMLEKEKRLAGILEGRDKPAAGDCLYFAAMCQLKGYYVASSRLFQEGFAQKGHSVQGLMSKEGYKAGCAAVLAGTGQGLDAAELDEAARASWRRQALDWLQASLQEDARLLGGGSTAVRPVVRRVLQSWRRNPDFAGVRDEAALAKLPEAEREAWRKLWADVDELLKRANE